MLDTTTGEPAVGVPVVLEYCEEPSQFWIALNHGETDNNGRLEDLLSTTHTLKPGVYRLRFNTSSRSSFFPEVTVQFAVSAPEQHYHIPLLLTRFGYTTYRGS